MRPSLETAVKVVKVGMEFATCFVLVTLGMFLIQLSRTTEKVGAQAQVSLQNIDTLTKQLASDSKDIKEMTNAALFQVGDASHEVADTARMQKGYWDQIGKESVKSFEHTNAILAALEETTKHVDQHTGEITVATVNALNAIPPTLEKSQEAMSAGTDSLKAATKVLSDPSIPQTLDHVNQTMAHVQNTSANVDKAVERMTKPQSLIKSLFTSLLDISYKLSSFFK
jgi:ABC-type transporter Mla subunit MlaD